MSLSKLWEMVKDRKPGVVQPMGWQRVGHNLATEQQPVVRTLLLLLRACIQFLLGS